MKLETFVSFYLYKLAANAVDSLICRQTIFQFGFRLGLNSQKHSFDTFFEFIESHIFCFCLWLCDVILALADSLRCYNNNNSRCSSATLRIALLLNAKNSQSMNEHEYKSAQNMRFKYSGRVLIVAIGLFVCSDCRCRRRRRFAISMLMQFDSMGFRPLKKKKNKNDKEKYTILRCNGNAIEIVCVCDCVVWRLFALLICLRCKRQRRAFI